MLLPFPLNCGCSVAKTECWVLLFLKIIFTIRQDGKTKVRTVKSYLWLSSPFYKKQSEPFKQTNPPFSVTFLLQNPHCILHIFRKKSKSSPECRSPVYFSRHLSSFFSCIQSYSIYFHFLEETCSFLAKDIYSGCCFSQAHQHSVLPAIQLCHCDLLS